MSVQFINNRIKRQYLAILVTLSMICLPHSTFAAELPAELQAVLLSKVLVYEKNLQEKTSVSVFIIKDTNMYDALTRLDNSQSNSIQFINVKLGDAPPTKKFDVIYLNDDKQLSSVLTYANQYGSVIATGRPQLVKDGATLGMGTEKGKPQFYLNLTTSLTSGLKWDQNIINVVKTFQ